MAPSKDVEELKTLFATPARPLSPPRESALPLTRIAKFSVADENSRLAAQGRLEKWFRKNNLDRGDAVLQGFFLAGVYRTIARV